MKKSGISGISLFLVSGYNSIRQLLLQHCDCLMGSVGCRLHHNGPEFIIKGMHKRWVTFKSLNRTDILNAVVQL